MPSTPLTTERLVLRPPIEEDLDAVFRVHGDPATNRFNPTGPHGSAARSRQTLNRWMAHWREYGFGYWSVALRSAPDEIIGFGGVMYKEVDGESRANLYFRFDPSAWGKGYATEMANAARDLAFGELDLAEIVATVRPDNAPSIRALERLGMTHAGDVSDRHGPSRLYVLRRVASP